MASVDSAELARVLREFLGGDRRYRKFVKLLSSPRSDGLLHFWQSAALDALEAKLGLVLPRRARKLRALLPALPEPTRLGAEAVPSWICIAELGGSVPVQGSGSAGSWRWYFHARHNSWSLGAVLGQAEDPAAVGGNSETTFYFEEEYGDLTDEASYMDLDEARFLIVRELVRLKESRCLDTSPTEDVVDDANPQLMGVCESCGVRTFEGAVSIGSSQIEKFRFCPRCRARFDRTVVDGQLEVEPDWMVVVQLPQKLSAAQLVALRSAYPDVANVGLAALRESIEGASVITLGPYWRPELAAHHRDRLLAAGLIVEVRARQT